MFKNVLLLKDDPSAVRGLQRGAKYKQVEAAEALFQFIEKDPKLSKRSNQTEIQEGSTRSRSGNNRGASSGGGEQGSDMDHTGRSSTISSRRENRMLERQGKRQEVMTLLSVPNHRPAHHHHDSQCEAAVSQLVFIRMFC